MQFFIDEKLPNVNMMALKTMGWDFIVKGIEFLDTQLGLEYISTPLSLLWKIIREALPCSAYAVKFMTSRLLKVQPRLTGLIQANVPSFVHQQFVESAIDVIVEIGNRHQKADSTPSNQDLYNFRATIDTLSHFLNDYKKSVHEKDEPSFPSSASDSMEIEDRKVIIARCAQTSGQKEVPPSSFLTNDSTVIFSSLLIPQSKYSKRLLRRNYLSSVSAYLRKAVKSIEKNRNRSKLFKNGDSKILNRS